MKKIELQSRKNDIFKKIFNTIKTFFHKKKYIVIDLEFNQGYKFQNKEYAKTQFIEFDKRPMEIIEIGAVLLNNKMKIKKTFSHFIKPQIYKDLRPYVTQLTKINQEVLESEGISFEEAFSSFEKWVAQAPKIILCTWDDIDIQVMKNNLRYHGINSELFDYCSTLDIQKVFNKDKKVGLKKALEELDIPANKQFHRAVDDAYMTAQVLRELHSIVAIAV